MSDRIALYPLVKAYPVIDSRTRSEAVCVAGVSATKPRTWIRLFPLDFRGLETEQQFKKYQRLELDSDAPLDVFRRASSRQSRYAGIL